MAPHASIWPVSKIWDGICQPSLDYTYDQNFVTRNAKNLAKRIHFIGSICIRVVFVKTFGKRDPVRLISIRHSSGTEWSSSAICLKEHRSTDLSLSLTHTHTHTHTNTHTGAQLLRAMELNPRIHDSVIWRSVVWYIKHCINASNESLAPIFSTKDWVHWVNGDTGKG